MGALLPFIVFLGGLEVLCGWICKRLNLCTSFEFEFAAVVLVTETILFYPISKPVQSCPEGLI